MATTVDSSTAPTTFQIGGLKVTFRPEGVYLRHTDKVNGSYGTDYFRDGNPFSEEEVGIILQIVAEFVAETAEECGREASRACATVIGVEHDGAGMEESFGEVSGGNTHCTDCIAPCSHRIGCEYSTVYRAEARGTP